MSEIQTRNIISEKLCKILERDQEIEGDQELHTLGMDSMKNIQLVVELEMIFDITLDDDDLLFENFVTVHKIEELVLRIMTKSNVTVG